MEMNNKHLNRLVAETLGHKVTEEFSDWMKLELCIEGGIRLPDYCSSPEHVWSIIIKNKIGLEYYSDDNTWTAIQGRFWNISEGYLCEDMIAVTHTDPLIAVILVFLKINGVDYDQ